MSFKKYIILAITTIASQASYAQYTSDAFRFSNLENSTSARLGAMGGQKSAIGGDLSSLYGNPAGLGMFTKSEFSFSPTINLKNSDINFLGNDSKIDNSNVDLSNIGVVFHTRTYKGSNLDKGLLSLNFGIGYQKRASYKNDFNFAGVTDANGLGYYFAETASSENNTPQNLQSSLNRAAYDSFIIDTIRPDLTNYRPNTYRDADQNVFVERRGGSSDINFNLAGNVSNKFFWGIGIGLTSFKYTSTESINERGLFTNPNNGSPVDYDVDYNLYFDTEGSGINLKLGMLFKPTKELRVGLNFESPTWFTVTDNYSEDFVNYLDNIDGTDSYPYEYDLRTPLKVNGGIAYFFGNKGFISADVGFVDYSSIQFSSSSTSQDNQTNRSIRNTYKNAINYSLGGEYKLDKNFLVRAGYQSTGNPYKGLSNDDYSIKSISGGLGYRFGDYYIDAAYINSSNNLLNYRSYALSGYNEPQANINTSSSRIALTFGVRF